MLQLKQQQLQICIQQVIADRERALEEKQVFISAVQQWIEVFADDLPLNEVIELETVETDLNNIAGVDIPVFQSCSFRVADYDLFSAPFWLEKGLQAIQEQCRIELRIRIFDKQIELLSDELRRTNQRVNLFEKILIPQTRENIRRIRITLSDQQTAAVARGKICKKKILERG